MFSHEEEKLGKIYDSKIMGRLMKYLGRDWWMIAVGALAGLIVALAQIISPMIIQRAIDEGIFKVVRLHQLSTDQAAEHSDHIYPVNDSLYAIPQQYLVDEKDFSGKVVDTLAYYLLDMEKAREKLSPEVLELYPQAGEDRLLVPVKDFVMEDRFPNKVLMVLRSADWQGLISFAIFFIILGIIRFIANFGQVILTTFAGQRSMHRLRMRIFSHLQRMPVQFFDRNPVGRLVTRSTNDVETLSQFFSEVVASLFYDGFLIVGLLVALPIWNWRLALVIFAVIPPMLAATIIFRRRLRDSFRMVRVRLAKINAFLAENLSGIKVVQIFRQEKKRLGKFHDINESHFEARFGQMVVFAIFRPIIDFLLVAAIAGIIWFGSGWVISDFIMIGALAAFLRYAEILFQPIRDLAEKFQVMQRAMASGERIFMLVDEAEEVYRGKKLPRTVQGEIEFRDVSFAYNDEDWVLKEINFRIKPGERVAFVGATGAGKTSIINTLCRFYEIQKGKILVDGHDARKLDKKDLRSRVGIVMQDVFLFMGDIETNIKLRSDISSQRVEEAAQVTNADKFITRLPEAYKSAVQERGVNLSVGERQLVAFARALAFDPAILILDEATSSVDTKTEALIQDAIHKLLEGRTSLIIAHRLSTVRDADRIVVLDHGRIVEQGTHDDLMSRKGVYYGLYKLQFEHKI